jgi:hypothetical protein
MKILKLNLPLKFLIPLLAIVILSVTSYAANVSVTNTTVQTENGVLFNVNGGFTGSSNGFIVTQSAASATSLPATWANGGTVTTATTAGNWQYSVTVTLNSGASTSTTYTVTVQWNTGSGYITMGTALTFTTLSTITAGQTMTFVFSTGVTSFNAPVGLLITIA